MVLESVRWEHLADHHLHAVCIELVIDELSRRKDSHTIEEQKRTSVVGETVGVVIRSWIQ
jgi:hypothetical protein